MPKVHEESCELYIEEEIEDGLQQGKSPYAIGKDISKWVEKLFSRKVPPDTIRKRVERTKKRTVDNVHSDPTTQNPSQNQNNQVVEHGGKREGSGRKAKYSRQEAVEPAQSIETVTPKFMVPGTPEWLKHVIRYANNSAAESKTNCVPFAHVCEKLIENKAWEFYFEDEPKTWERLCKEAIHGTDPRYIERIIQAVRILEGKEVEVAPVEPKRQNFKDRLPTSILDPKEVSEARIGPRAAKDPSGKEYAIQTVYALKTYLESREISEGRVKRELGKIKERQYWTVLGYSSLDELLKCETGKTEDEITSKVASSLPVLNPDEKPVSAMSHAILNAIYLHMEHYKEITSSDVLFVLDHIISHTTAMQRMRIIQGLEKKPKKAKRKTKKKPEVIP